MSLSRAEAAEYLLRLKRAESNFLDFVRCIFPDYKLEPFQLELIDVLDRLEKGTLRNAKGEVVRKVLINMPPRHAKSTFATQLFPVYFQGRDPRRDVMSTSYNGDLAKTFGRSVKDTIAMPIVRQIFPHLDISDETRAVDFFKTTEGGAYYSIGMGGTTTGRAANLLLVDDPLKSRQEADSPTLRNQNWSYYTAALTTRKQPDRAGNPPIEVVVLTRWHPDDLAGRIMETPDWKNGEWYHVNFPAIITKNTGVKVRRDTLPITDPRYAPKDIVMAMDSKDRWVSGAEEVALWPSRFPLEELRKRRALDPREFDALYMQSPYTIGGNMFKTSWWREFDLPATPDDMARYQTVIITADTAFKANTTSDYSVLLTAGLTMDGDIHILDVLRKRLEFPDLKRAAVQTNAKWRGRGLRGMYIEDKASGQSLIQELKKESGIAVLPYKNPSDKVTRASAVTPLIEGGRVFLPKEAPWLDDFMTETQQFPSSSHDDQVDALTMALDILSRVPATGAAMLNDPIIAATNNIQYDSWLTAPLQSNPRAHVDLHKAFSWPTPLGE